MTLLPLVRIEEVVNDLVIEEVNDLVENSAFAVVRNMLVRDATERCIAK